MKNWVIRNYKVKVGVTEECGFLDPVVFNIGNKEISPLNIAPWHNEELDDSTPPMLRNLRNDFFCAPFGENDLLNEESGTHGFTANGKWNLINAGKDKIELELSKKVMGAKIKKIISITEDHPVVYEEHIFEGGEGKIPVGHHLMLKAEEQLLLSFSKYIFGATPPSPIETDPALGKSLLLYPQEFNNLNEVKLSNGETADLTKYPSLKDHEDLLMIVSYNELPFAWSSAASPKSGWLFFSIKSPKVLRNTVLWFSNGGRFYPPFSGRHKNVIGIEETSSFFHLGHKASINKNLLSEKGIKSFIELKNETYNVKYMFGLVPIQNNFLEVKTIEACNDGINIIDKNGVKIFAKVNLNFIYEN